jgi:hypothetical protein
MARRKRYTVNAVRDGSWWGIEVDGVDGAFSQARRIDQVEAMAREVVSLLLDVEPDSFDLDVRVHYPAEWAALAEEVTAARAAAEQAEKAAGVIARQAARLLHDAGLPVRDVGAVLNVSPQRVSQLLALAPPASAASLEQQLATMRTATRQVSASLESQLEAVRKAMAPMAALGEAVERAVAPLRMAAPRSRPVGAKSERSGR